MSGVDSSSRSTKVKKLPTTRMSTTVITKYYNPLWGMTDEVMNGWAFTRAIQQSALYNFYSKQTINFIENNNTFTVDTKTQNPPNLQMEPAMSYIWSLPFVVISEDIESLIDKILKIHKRYSQLLRRR